MRLACDLAPIAVVKSGGRPPVLHAAGTAAGLEWTVPDGGRVEVVAHPAPDRVDALGGRLAWDLGLGPSEERSIELAVRRRRPPAPNGAVVLAAEPAAAGGEPFPPALDCDDHRLEPFLARSLADLHGLRMATTDTPGDAFLAAGVPWFLTLFGQDSISAAAALPTLAWRFLPSSTGPSTPRRNGYACCTTHGAGASPRTRSSRCSNR